MKKSVFAFMFAFITLFCLTGCGATAGADDWLSRSSASNSTGETELQEPPSVSMATMESAISSETYASTELFALFERETFPTSENMFSTYATKEILKYKNESAATLVQIAADASTEDVQYVVFSLPKKLGETGVVAHLFPLVVAVTNAVYPDDVEIYDSMWEWFYSFFDAEEPESSVNIGGISCSFERDANDCILIIMCFQSQESLTSLQDAKMFLTKSVEKYTYKDPEDIAIIESILQSDAMRGTEEKNINVGFLNEEKIVSVSVTMDGVEIFTSNYYTDLQKRKSWDEYVDFQKRYSEEVKGILVGTQKETWSVVLLTLDDYDKTHLMLENGAVIYNAAEE